MTSSTKPEVHKYRNAVRGNEIVARILHAQKFGEARSVAMQTLRYACWQRETDRQRDRHVHRNTSCTTTGADRVMNKRRQHHIEFGVHIVPKNR